MTCASQPLRPRCLPVYPAHGDNEREYVLSHLRRGVEQARGQYTQPVTGARVGDYSVVKGPSGDLA